MKLKKERKTVLRDRDTERVFEGKEGIQVMKGSLITKTQVVFVKFHNVPSSVLTLTPGNNVS